MPIESKPDETAGSQKPIATIKPRKYRIVIDDRRNPPPSSKTDWKGILLAFTPLVVAVTAGWINNSIQEASIRKDYVKMAVDVLSQPASSSSSPDPLRGWAVQIIDKQSPAKFDALLREKLVSGDVSLPPSGSGERHKLAEEVSLTIAPSDLDIDSFRHRFCIVETNIGLVEWCPYDTAEACERARNNVRGLRCEPRPDKLHCFAYTTTRQGAPAKPVSCFTSPDDCEYARMGDRTRSSTTSVGLQCEIMQPP
jgi:hypothetical protein